MKTSQGLIEALQKLQRKSRDMYVIKKFVKGNGTSFPIWKMRKPKEFCVDMEFWSAY